MDDFLNWKATVLERVRFRPDRQAIAVELTAHYEDHVRDLERLDYPPELAKQRALDAMGDPELIGRALDRVHKPWLGWLWMASRALLTMACLLCLRKYRSLRPYAKRHRLFERQAMARFFSVNRDIFFRTLCIVAVTVFFTSTGAAYGDVVLAVNTLLMQLFTLFSYVMDGFAYAGEALSGKHIGAGNRTEFRRTVRHLFGWGTALAAAFTLLYGIGGKNFLGLLTDDTEVIRASGDYFLWVLAIPAAGFSAFLLDGICIGATATRIMLHAIFIASTGFFLIYYGMCSTWGNHALWTAFIIYLALRGIAQALLSGKLLKGRNFPTFADKH